MKNDYYILFENYTQGMMLQKEMRKENIASRIAPAPRTIQGELGCGMSLLIQEEEIAKAKSCIERNHLPYYDIVMLPRQINPRRNKYC